MFPVLTIIDRTPNSKVNFLFESVDHERLSEGEHLNWRTGLNSVTERHDFFVSRVLGFPETNENNSNYCSNSKFKKALQRQEWLVTAILLHQ